MSLSKRNKMIVGISGIPLIFCLLNYFANWHLFAGYDLPALVVATALVFVVAQFLRGDRTYRNMKMSASNRKKQAIIAVAGIPFLFCLANYLAGWHVFGGYDRTALVICTAVVFVLVQFFRDAFEGGDA